MEPAFQQVSSPPSLTLSADTQGTANPVKEKEMRADQQLSLAAEKKLCDRRKGTTDQVV
jgi:hypothetical protein